MALNTKQVREERVKIALWEIEGQVTAKEEQGKKNTLEPENKNNNNTVQ